MKTRFAALFLLAFAGSLHAQAPRVTTPKEHFGFNMGDDYHLANYQQLMAYWAKLEKESERIKVAKVGTTEDGRPQLMAIITSPANHKKLDRYREISRRMGRVENVSEQEARALSAEGKAVVWIDAGLHANETLCAQMMIETIYQLLSETDAETNRILDDVIVLFVHANPDGHDFVADWYMRESDPKKRSLNGIPKLYQKYAGHDNNRDFFANNLAETRNMNRVMYHEWLPQIVYNHHQSGPPGTVLFCPPFRDPFNYNVDPLVISGIDAVGAAMMQRFLVENKPGATTRSGTRYSTWWNGGLRTACYFHNMIGLLTETIGSPNPMSIPFRPQLQLPKADYLAPIEPQPWHFRQSVDYSVTANKAVFDYASRHREQLLSNIWLMGKNAIDRGNRDNWTTTPTDVDAARAANPEAPAGGGRGGRAGGAAEFKRAFRNPEQRDPRGFIIPSNQPDFLTATKFVNTLINSGLTIHRATARFKVNGKDYPAGSYVVKSAQPFRAHVLDMFEPQDHPNDFPYPGAPPTAPYDIAGWTLAYQMGVKFDRILDGFDGPFEVVKDERSPPPARITATDRTVGYYLDNRTNDAFRSINQLLAAGEEVRRLKEPFVADGVVQPPGIFFVAKKATTLSHLEKISSQIGTRFLGTTMAPAKEAVALKPVRIGLVDRYGGSMPSGWTRWVLDRFEYPYKVVFPPELDRGNLRDKFDVLILPDGAFSPRGPGTTRAEVTGGDLPPPPADDARDESNIPEQYRGQRGSITAAKTLPHLKAFLEAGGTILTIGSSTSLGNQLGLTIGNHLVEKDEEGKERTLPRTKFYVPGSILRVKLDNEHPLGWGLEKEIDVMFSASPTFKLPADAKGLQKVAWFDSRRPLRSGWAWGQEHLDGGTAIIDAEVGKGRLVMFGPQILFRAQPHGTFKLLFNGIVRAGMGE